MGIFCCILCQQTLFNVSHWAFNVVANCCKSVMKRSLEWSVRAAFPVQYCLNCVTPVMQFYVFMLWSKSDPEYLAYLTSVGLEKPMKAHFVELAKTTSADLFFDLIFRCAYQRLSWSILSPASASSSCPPLSRRAAAWARSPWLSDGSSCWQTGDRVTWRWHSTGT